MKILFFLLLCLSIFGDEVKSRLEAFIKKEGVSGLTCALVTPKWPEGRVEAIGKPLAAASFSLTETTPFRLGRLTEAFMFPLFFVLDGEKKIDLKAPIAKTFSRGRLRLVKHGEKITFEDLLSHRSGLQDTLYPKPELRELSTSQLFDVFERWTLTHRARVISRYNYALAAACVDRQLNCRIEKLFQEKIATPYGFQETMFDLPLLQKSRAALIERWEGEAPKGNSILAKAAGLFSTTQDLTLFLRSCLGYRTPELSLPPLTTLNGRSFAMGWDISPLSSQVQLPLYEIEEHYLGASLYLAVVPSMRIGVFLFCLKEAPLKALGRQLLLDLCL